MNVISAWQVDVSSSGRPLPSFVKHRCLPTHVYHRGTSHLVPTTRTRVTAYAKRPGIKRAQHDALLDLDLALNGKRFQRKRASQSTRWEPRTYVTIGNIPA